jgi:hypothetical protein
MTDKPPNRPRDPNQLATHSVRSSGGCACRKSNPDILIMQPAQYRSTIDMPRTLNGARY